MNTSNLFEGTLYFVRTELLHFDLVVPSNFAEDRNINTDSDSDASIVIIDEVNADDVVEINERNEPIDYSFDANEQNEEENPFQSATSDQAVPDGFDYVNPPAEYIFQFLLVEPIKYKVMTPLKRVRENKLYTIRDCVLSDISCDDNGVGAYNRTNKVKHNYYVVVDEDGVQVIKWVHKSKDGYFYKKRVSSIYRCSCPYKRCVYIRQIL